MNNESVEVFGEDKFKISTFCSCFINKVVKTVPPMLIIIGVHV